MPIFIGGQHLFEAQHLLEDIHGIPHTKKKTGGGGRVEDMEFSGILKK